MRFLAIDPGDKRTGLALGDDVTRIASALAVITTTSPAQRLAELRRWIDKEGPDAVVIGLPLNMDGTAGPAAKAAQTLAASLAETFTGPIHLMDERLTSAAADEQLAGRDLTRKRKKARRDALAAATILRDFFEQQA